MSEDDLAAFLAATGTDDLSMARRYFEMVNDDLNEAVSMYFEVGPALLPPTGDCDADSAALASDLGNPSRGIGYDRQSSHSAMSDDAVREAVPAFQETLLQTHDFRYNSRGPSHRSAEARMGSGASSAAARVIDVTDVDGDNVLDSLFAPPTELLHSGTFDEAKAAAAETSRLLLVNIQDPTDFSCMKLNRDVWHNSTIQCVVESHFVFWQRNFDCPEAETFAALYKVSKYPHIAAVEPRTGRQLHRWPAERFNMPEDAACELIMFIESRNTPQDPNVNTVRSPRRTANSRVSPQSISSSSSSSPSRLSGDSTSASPTLSNVPKKTNSNNTAKRSKVDTSCRSEDDLSNRQSVADGGVGTAAGTTQTAASEEYGGINSELAKLRKARESRNRVDT